MSVAVKPDVRLVKSLAQVPEIPGYQRKFAGAVVSRDAAYNVGIRHASPVVYYLQRADRAYYFVPVPSTGSGQRQKAVPHAA